VRDLVEEAGRDIRLAALIAPVGLDGDAELTSAGLGGEAGDLAQVSDPVGDLSDLLGHGLPPS
jgi:hypothetical protein